MYSLLKPILFRMDAESAHERSLRWLSSAERLGLARGVAERRAKRPVVLMGMSLPNPVGLAAGMDKNASCVDGMAALGFGFIEVGTVTPRPQAGNPKPRLFRIESEEAVLNRMGFNNDGVEALVENVQRARYRGVLGVNIGKNATTPIENAVDDYLLALRAAHPVASYVTVNISSPNTKRLRDLQEEGALRVLLEALMGERDKLDAQSSRKVPLAVKIAPDIDRDMVGRMCGVFKDVGVEGVIATNTTLDKSSLRSNPLASEAGGLSGRPLRRKSDEVLSWVVEEVGDAIDVIGAGGIMTPEDARRKLELGAKAVQILSGMIYGGPGLPGRIVRHLAQAGRGAARPGFDRVLR